MVTTLTCPECKGYLPPPAAGARFLQCQFCGVTVQLGEVVTPPPPRVVPPRPAEPPPPFPRLTDTQRFGDAFEAARAGGAELVPALESAAASTLAEWGDQRAMTNAVANLALDFERDTGAEATAQKVVIQRLADAYYRAANELAMAPTRSTEINLPFLSATTSGPVHLARTLTAGDLAVLCASVSPRPSPRPAAPPEPPPEEPPKKKKRGWFR